MCNTDRQHRMCCLPICRSWLTEPSIIYGIKHLWGRGNVSWPWILFSACFLAYQRVLGLSLRATSPTPIFTFFFFVVNCEGDVVCSARGSQSLVGLGPGLSPPGSHQLISRGRLMGLSARGALPSPLMGFAMDSAWSWWEAGCDLLIASQINARRCRLFGLRL